MQGDSAPADCEAFWLNCVKNLPKLIQFPSLAGEYKHILSIDMVGRVPKTSQLFYLYDF
mgnify:CR=1 FL=1